MQVRIPNILQTEVQRFQSTFSKWNIEDVFQPNGIKYKRCGKKHLVLLYIPKDVITNEERVDIFDKRFAKFRAQKAWCVSIINTDTLKTTSSYFHDSHVYSKLEYNVNQWIYPDDWGNDPEDVCTHGIHFFNHWIAAYYHHFPHNLSEMDISIRDDGSIYSIRHSEETNWCYKDETIKRFIKDKFKLDIQIKE